MTKKVIALTRVSTLSQELESQKLKVISAIHADGYTDDEIISISNKESGVLLSEEEMLGLDQMKREILERPTIEAVYVFELSRVARQAKILYSIRDFLIQNKVQFVCLNPPFRMLTAEKIFDESSNVIFGLYCSLAENEGYIRKQRFKRGKEKAKREGRYIGGRILFGYTLDENNRFIPDPVNKKTVQRIFQMYSEGKYSARQISRILYNEKVINQTSEKARETFICKILKNANYTGINKNYEGIIDRRIFEQCQHWLKDYQIKAKRAYSETVYIAHKLLFVKISDKERQMLVRKADAAYVEPISGYCISINMVESLLLYLTEYARDFHSSTDIETARERLKEEILQTEKRLNNYTEQENDIKKKIDLLEERMIYGRISAEKAGAIERKLEEELKKSSVSREKDRSLLTILMKNLEATEETKTDLKSIYELEVEEQKIRVHEEIEKCWLLREKNSWYEIRVKFCNPLIDGQIWKLKSKARKFIFGGKEVKVKYIDRIKRK